MYNTKEVFDRYTEVEYQSEADIFHLYDTGEECMKDNSGYHDSRHFILWTFNTKTMEKCNQGRHDSMTNSGNATVDIMRVYANGSFMIRFKGLVKMDIFQNVIIY